MSNRKNKALNILSRHASDLVARARALAALVVAGVLGVEDGAERRGLGRGGEAELPPHLRQQGSVLLRVRVASARATL